MKVYVYMYAEHFGGGLVFVREDKKCKYESDRNYKYLGTLQEFVKNIKIDLVNHNEVNFVYME